MNPTNEQWRGPAEHTNSEEPGALALQRLRTASQGLPTVLICGRPNVGKSSLFNRIAGAQRAIVSEVPGATRDFNLTRVRADEREFAIVDSGGLGAHAGGALSEKLAHRTMDAARAADAIIFVVDGRAGLNPEDQQWFDALRRANRPLVVAVNKLDRPAMDLLVADFQALGTEQIFPVSAAHGRGLGELLDALAALLPQETESGAGGASDLRFALIGRPNVGKSSLVNRVAGFERSAVDSQAGTTRDPVDIEVTSDGRRILLIDTGGVRRQARIETELEHRVVARALATIRRAEVLGLVIDAAEGPTDQDARLAALVDKHDRALMLVVNKWDLAAAQERNITAFARDLRTRWPFLEYAPAVFCSALTGNGVGDILRVALEVGKSFRAVFKTPQLNRILGDVVGEIDPPVIERRRLKLMYVTQRASSPPRLLVFANLERDIPVHYLRFLQGRFRAALNLVGTPLRIAVRRADSSRGGIQAFNADEGGEPQS